MDIPTLNSSRPIVGVSACLVGEKVRYDGTDKLNSTLIEQLTPFVELYPFCPEVMAGMGIPRNPIALEIQTNNSKSAIEAVYQQGPKKGKRVTQQLTKVAEQFLNSQQQRPLSAYIFKSRSPSCGLRSTPIREGGQVVRTGNGLFAHAIQSAWPTIASVEDEWFIDGNSVCRFLTATHLVHWQRYSNVADSVLLNLLSLTTNDLLRRSPNQIRAAINELLKRETTTVQSEQLLRYWESKAR